MSNKNKADINILVDSVGRTIVGKISETKTSVDVENPTVVNIEVKQETGQIAVQLIPYIFKEFVSANNRDKPVTWSFPKNLVVVNKDLEVDNQLIQQYENVFNPPPVAAPAAPAPAAEPEVVKLFDE